MNIRQARKTDLEAISALMQAVFKLNATPDWLEHYHYHNPAGQSILYVAEDEQGQIVSFRSIVKMRAFIGGSPVLLGQLVNAVTRKDYRGKGLFGQMQRLALQDLWDSGGRAAYCFPGPMSYPIHRYKFGFQEPFNFRNYVFPLTDNVLAGQIGKVPARMLTASHAVLFGHRRARSNAKTGDKGNAKACTRVATIDFQPAKCAAGSTLIERLSYPEPSGDAFAFERSTEFLRWRLMMPNRDYTIAFMDPDNFAILGSSVRAKARFCNIMDLRFSETAFLKQLLREIIGWAQDNHYDALRVWPRAGHAQHHEQSRESLQFRESQPPQQSRQPRQPRQSWQPWQFGFIPAPQKTKFLICFNGNGEPTPAAGMAATGRDQSELPAVWDISLLDTDAY